MVSYAKQKEKGSFERLVLAEHVEQDCENSTVHTKKKLLQNVELEARISRSQIKQHSAQLTITKTSKCYHENTKS